MRFASLAAKILSFVIAGTVPLAPQCVRAQQPLRAGTIFSATQAPLWAAREGRYFEQYGIRNLEVIQFSGGQPVTRALIGGDIQISTTGGQKIRGVRLNEDTHSIQLRDDKGQLRSVLKRDIAEMELIRKSPMPNFSGAGYEPASVQRCARARNSSVTDAAV